MMDRGLFRGSLKLEIIKTIMECLEEHGVDFTVRDETVDEKIRPFVANLAASLDRVIDLAMQRLEAD